jgi:tetratricopeptide (TPR) repeat protein
MKATIQKEDLQHLGNILQERLVAQVPDRKEFQVKCAMKNDELMVLTEHPSEVIVNTEQVFEVLEQALQWQFNYQTEQVQLFLRKVGEKRAYSRHTLYFQISAPQIDMGNKTENGFEMPTIETERDINYTSERDTLIIPPDSENPRPSFLDIEEEAIEDSFASSSSTSFGDYSSTDTISSLDEDESEPIEETEEEFDPFANVAVKSEKKGLSISLPPLPIVIGTAIVIALVSGSAAFLLHRGCVIGECKELQTGQQFKNEYPQQVKRAKSGTDLLTLQKQLDQVVEDLHKIPQWSPRYQESQLLANSFSEQSTKIKTVITALEAAGSAQKTSQTPPRNLDELRNRQTLWRQAISSLEIIKPGHEFYGIVKTSLPTYQNSFKSINQRLTQEETWLQKIATAKTAGEAATKLQATAKSAPEWQKVASNFQTAINILKVIPVDILGIEDARKLLGEYELKNVVARNRAKKEQIAATSYQQAIIAANQAKAYDNQKQWQAAVKSWEQAVQNAKQVSENTFYFNQAKSLVETYNASLQQSQQQYEIYGDLTSTRNELTNTCNNTIKICIYTIENQEIKVRLTPEYDRLFQANNPEIQGHFQRLQEALKVISQNAQMPVYIYNSQGQERYMRKPL